MSPHQSSTSGACISTSTSPLDPSRFSIQFSSSNLDQHTKSAGTRQDQYRAFIIADYVEGTKPYIDKMSCSAEDEAGRVHDPDSQIGLMKRALADYGAEQLETSYRLSLIKEEVSTGKLSQAKTLKFATEEIQTLTKGLKNTESTLNKMAALRFIVQARLNKWYLEKRKSRTERKLSAKIERLKDLAKKARTEAEKKMRKARQLEDSAMSAELEHSRCLRRMAEQTQETL